MYSNNDNPNFKQRSISDVINTFIDNAELTKSNSLTHILDFDHEDEHNDLLESIQTSHYYTETDFIKNVTLTHVRL